MRATKNSKHTLLWKKHNRQVKANQVCCF